MRREKFYILMLSTNNLHGTAIPHCTERKKIFGRLVYFATEIYSYRLRRALNSAFKTRSRFDQRHIMNSLFPVVHL
jgi:hypothetical protein